MTYWIILTSMRCLNFQKLSEQTHANTMRSLQIIHLGSMSTYIPPWSGGNGWKSRSGHSDILYCTRVLFQIHPSRRSQILGSSLLRWSKQRCVLSFFPSFMRSIACAWWLGSLPHGVFFSIPCAKKKLAPKKCCPRPPRIRVQLNHLPPISKWFDHMHHMPALANCQEKLLVTHGLEFDPLSVSKSPGCVRSCMQKLFGYHLNPRFAANAVPWEKSWRWQAPESLLF